MTDQHKLSRRAFLGFLGGMGGSVVLVACGGAGTTAAPTPGEGSAATAAAPAPTAAGGAAATEAPAAAGTTTIHFLSAQAQDEGYTHIISLLAQEYQAQNPNVVYKYEQAPQTGLDEKILLLAGSNSLPTLFADPATGTLNEMFANGLVADTEAVFTELGIFDQLRPVAVNLLKKLGNGSLPNIPTELNVEGFWYNKQIFADNGIEVPTTWADLVAAAETLSAAGIQPFAASGEQGWPITRLIGGYAARKYGADVMDRVASGELKLTDPGFVEAATAVADLGAKGYFGEGIATIDYATALDQFVQGQAAMFYMGSWELRTFNNPEATKIGAENIGLFNVPTVPEGVGTLEDWSMNAGLTISIGKAQYDANPQVVGDWLRSVFSQYGDRAMAELGMITGFVVNNPPADISALTQQVEELIGSAQNAYLWFEAPFNSEATTMSQRNAALLMTGDMSPEDFLSELQNTIA